MALSDAVPAPFLALSDGAKNRLMAAEGALLLLCAAGPGMLLLLRVRRTAPHGTPRHPTSPCHPTCPRVRT